MFLRVLGDFYFGFESGTLPNAFRAVRAFEAISAEGFLERLQANSFGKVDFLAVKKGSFCFSASKKEPFSCLMKAEEVSKEGRVTLDFESESWHFLYRD